MKDLAGIIYFINFALMDSTIICRNRTKKFSQGNTKLFLRLPNSRSDQYRLRLANDWKLRICQEIEDYNSSGGRVVLLHLTYNNSHLPIYNAIEDGKAYSFPCFSKKDKDDYIKYIKNYLYRKYGLTGPDDPRNSKRKKWFNKAGLPITIMSKPFRYMWPCEYGMSDGSTHRPHYHVLLYLPREFFEIPEFNTEKSIRNFLTNTWSPRGFVYFSKKAMGGMYVTRDCAADYVSKYCFKDFQFLSRPDVKEYLTNEDGSRNKAHYELMRGKLPSHWQSYGFGLGLVEKFDDYESMRDGLDFEFTHNVEGGTKVLSKCPQYIRRKILMYQDEDRAYHLNEKGLSWRLREFVEKLDDRAQRTAACLSAWGITKYASDEKISDMFGEKFGCHSAQQLHDYITRILGDRIYHEFVLFESVWSGLVVPDQLSISRLDRLSFDDFLHESVNQYYNTLSSFQYVTAQHEDGYFYSLTNQQKNAIITCDSARRFKGFSDIIYIRDRLYNWYYGECNRAYLERRKRRKELKNMVV